MVDNDISWEYTEISGQQWILRNAGLHPFQNIRVPKVEVQAKSEWRHNRINFSLRAEIGAVQLYSRRHIVSRPQNDASQLGLDYSVQNVSF